MKHILIFPAILLSVFSLSAQQVDPYHTSTGGFGYPVSSSPSATVWWAEGTYKIMQDMPAPSGKAKAVSIAGAKNEWESFQVVVKPERSLSKVKVSVTDLSSKKGKVPSSAITVRKVEYVPVTRATDNYGKTGLWPDPLPSYKAAEDLLSGRNHPFWITVKVPGDTPAGVYTGKVLLSSADGWNEEVPVSLEVWDFTLPDTPTMRSGFGFGLGTVMKYNNLTTPEQRQKAFDMSMKAFSEHRISPYNPFELTPIRETVSGIPWNGGFFDPDKPHGGKYSLKVTDNSYTSTPEATLREMVPVTGGKPYTASWWSRAEKEDQTFVVGFKCYDKDGKLLTFENRFEAFVCGKDWKAFTYDLGTLPQEAAKVSVHLYPSRRMVSGNDLGTTWFDDLELRSGDGGKNVLPDGSFEVDLDKIDISLDFSDFLPAARKYFGKEYGFNAFRMILKGLGSGTFYERVPGVFAGFVQGTKEYDKLMSRYLKQMQDALEEGGILGKEYIYWFDEPGENDYDFVRETNKMIKDYAPKITTFLTEHLAGHDVSDVTDITCSIWNHVDHEKAKKVQERGNEYWTYLCTGPKSPWITLFTDHDAINMRMWSWGSYVHGLSGLLIWETTYWNSIEASPEGTLQNPWEEAMSFTTSYGLIQGRQATWGNGDGRLFYPENRHVGVDTTPYLGELVPSYRAELLRDGIEDYEYFKILEKLAAQKPRKASAAKRLLNVPTSIYSDEQHYNKDPQAILQYRRRLAAAIVSLSK
ncbi:MAG: DUF4091 domain-containing protein [Bacteroidales bacterium]|nr:DUF4091 domain-containing protein [Bacteroidales bacterium]